MEQIQVYANPKFNEFQMSQIKQGFEHGLSINEIYTYVGERVNSEFMREIRLRFEHGLSNQQIMQYAKSEFNAEDFGHDEGNQMQQVFLTIRRS